MADAVAAGALDSTGLIKKATWTFTSATGGAIPADTAKVNGFDGQIIRASIVPDGVEVPSDGYDIFLYDEDGVDTLHGLGTGLTGATTYDVVPVLTDGTAGNMAPVAVNGSLDLVIADAGDEKEATVVIYLR